MLPDAAGLSRSPRSALYVNPPTPSGDARDDESRAVPSQGDASPTFAAANVVGMKTSAWGDNRGAMNARGTLLAGATCGVGFAISCRFRRTPH